MRYRALDANGDMTFGGSQANFLIDSPQAVAQAVQTSLKLWYGEWYLDQTAGVPYLESVLGFNSQATADSAIKTAILGVTATISSTNVPSGTSPGQVVQAVNTIDNYSSSINTETRAYTVSCTLNTIYGPTEFQTTYSNDS